MEAWQSPAGSWMPGYGGLFSGLFSFPKYILKSVSWRTRWLVSSIFYMGCESGAESQDPSIFGFSVTLPHSKFTHKVSLHPVTFPSLFLQDTDFKVPAWSGNHLLAFCVRAQLGRGWGRPFCGWFLTIIFNPGPLTPEALFGGRWTCFLSISLFLQAL